MSGFSLLPYLTRQKDPFSAVLAGKMAAQKRRDETVKWLANYQMQLERMAMSKAAAGRAQQLHDARMKQLRSGGGAPTQAGIGLGGVVQGVPGQPVMRGGLQAMPGSIIGTPGVPFRRTGPIPMPSTERFNTPGGFGFPQITPNPYLSPAAPAPAPAPARAQTPDLNPISTMQGFSDAGSFGTDQLDAGIDKRLAALDEGLNDEDDDETKDPFRAFA